MPDTVMTTTERPSLKQLAAALCKAQSEMEGAKKQANNPHFNRKYADLASVWETIREPLTKNGLSVVQLLRSVEGGVEVETVLLHTSGEQIGAAFSIPASKVDAQGFGSAATYARRYSLMALVGVAPEEDDGNAAVASHKPGANGTAAAGGNFRPERRQASASGARAAQEEPHLIDNTRPKGTLPAKEGAAPDASAIKRMEWVKKSIEGFKIAQTKDELTQWWKAEKDRLGVIETALPTEYDRLVVAFDDAIERTAQRAA